MWISRLAWCPVGPCIVRPESLRDPNALEFNTKLNDKLVQKGSTADLLVAVVRLPLSFLP